MKTLRTGLVRAMPILLAGLLPAGLAAQTIVLTDVNIIDGHGGPVQEGMTIVIAGQRIASIVQGPYESSGADDAVQVHDLDGAWVLPGFWNMHAHLSVMFPDNPALAGERMPSKVIRAGLNSIDGLRHGFTSVRSVGEEDYIDVAWQQAFDHGFFLGPRVFASGEPVSPTAGHRGYVEEGADGVAAIRKEVRKRVQNGARAIKLQFVLSGVSEMDTIIAATRNAADVQGVLGDLGTVEEGKLADLVVLGANPLENISNIRETVMVLKGGVIVDLDAQLGTSTYWDYYGSMELPEGFLAESEEAAGFQRGNTATDQ